MQGDSPPLKTAMPSLSHSHKPGMSLPVTRHHQKLRHFVPLHLLPGQQPEGLPQAQVEHLPERPAHAYGAAAAAVYRLMLNAWAQAKHVHVFALPGIRLHWSQLERPAPAHDAAAVQRLMRPAAQHVCAAGPPAQHVCAPGLCCHLQPPPLVGQVSLEVEDQSPGHPC